MSYPRLVGYAHHPQAESKKLSDEIIFFVVERGTAQMTDPSGVVDRRAVLFMHECALAWFSNAICHDVHRAIQRNLRPLLRARRTAFHFCFAPMVRQQL